jgi:UDP-N-acetylglucosamine:LPS N-acetylglucosamine transferase
MPAADLTLARAGATTIAEVAALGYAGCLCTFSKRR